MADLHQPWRARRRQHAVVWYASFWEFCARYCNERVRIPGERYPPATNTLPLGRGSAM